MTLYIAEELRRPAPAETTLIAAERRTTDAVIVIGERQFLPTLHRGWVWCRSCGVGMAVERVREHRCEGGAT